MTSPRTSAAVLLAALATAATVVLLAQSAPQPLPPAPSASGMNHNLVLLDPAHGGPDAGARLGPNVAEKDVTLALADRLRAVLTSEGFTVVSTRDADPAAAIPNAERAEAANRTHAVACLVLHATGTGAGVHLYASSLEPDEPTELDPGYKPPFEPTPWDQAQAPSVPQSLHLESDLAKAVTTAGLPLTTGRAPVAPLNNLTCPAVALELAPLGVQGGTIVPVTDPNYQQHVAETVARSLLFWRGHAEPPPRQAVPTTEDWMKAIPATSAKPAARPASKPSATQSSQSGTRTGQSLGGDVLDGAGDGGKH